MLVQEALYHAPSWLLRDDFQLNDPANHIVRPEDGSAFRAHCCHLISGSSTCCGAISNLCKPRSACPFVGGSKVTVPRKAIMVRVPVVLLRTIERITEVEGWGNRQAFMEQALREKVERWEREHPLGMPRRGR